MSRKHFVAVVAATLGLVVLGPGLASGQDYPAKPIRIYASAAGGGGDISARLIAEGIRGRLGQPVIVENRGGEISPQTVLKAAPDGYSLLISGSGFAMAPILEPLGYDGLRDFSPITLTTRSPYILVVHPSLPVKSLKDLIALAKAKPGELNYGSSAPGTAGHLAGELLKSMAGINLYVIPHQSAAVAMRSLLGGEVHLMMSSTFTGMPHVKSGKVRALAVTSLESSPLAPGLPTMAASGVPEYEYIGFDGIFAPAKTPTAIIHQLNGEIVRFLNTTEAKEKFLSIGQEVVASSPEELANKMKSEIAKLSKLMRDLGLIKAR